MHIQPQLDTGSARGGRQVCAHALRCERTKATNDMSRVEGHPLIGRGFVKAKQVDICTPV